MICKIEFTDGTTNKIINVIHVSKLPYNPNEEDNIFVYTRNKKTGKTKEHGYKSSNIKYMAVREAY